MNEVKRFKVRGSREIEVVRRRSKRKPEQPAFGGPESALGERVQKDLDYMVLGDILHAMKGNKKP